SVEVDRDDKTSPGFKFAETELAGIPLRMEIGPKEMEAKEVVLVRRDTGEKMKVPATGLVERIRGLCDEIQNNLFHTALLNRKNHTHILSTYKDLVTLMEGDGGFVDTGWCGDPACEAKIKEETKATIRNIPLGREELTHKSCIYCGKDSCHDVIIAKAY
ncbi:MAG: proline--tRNA ligase, partial [Spirochaetaceae bacterium]